MTVATGEAFLIVNADDYGYFRCVSQGILESASGGIVTATGVFANSTHFAEHAAWLRDFGALDAGVHLNLTVGNPLTPEMRQRLSRWAGRFRGKFSMAMAIASGAIRAEDVKVEWRAQIERCLESGLRIRFLNSHEHMHMLPSLFALAGDLAKDFGIPHVRFPTSRLEWRLPIGSLLRGSIIRVLETANRGKMRGPAAQFLGMDTSGRLDMPYLERCIPQLAAGQVYELMCHPGRFDAREIQEPRLTRYHDWEGELGALTSLRARELLERHGVRLIGYRHLEISDNRLLARREAA